MNKKVVLYNPDPKIGENQIDISLALLSISSILDKKGYNIIIVNHSYKNSKEMVVESCKDAICFGIGMMTGSQIKDGLSIIKMVKEKYPNLKIVVGGWHPSILPIQTIKSKYIDIVIKGQGQRTFTDVVEALYKEKSFKKIKGVIYKENDKIIENPDREFEDLNNFPELPYHLIPEDKLIRNVTEISSRIIDYFTSQGCPYNCGFCADPTVYKRRTTLLKAKRVIKDLEFFIKKYNANGVVCTDTNFFIDEKRVRDICKGIINKKLNIKWGSINGRADHLLNLSDETWDLLKKSNFHSFLVGAESGRQETLDILNKQIKVENLIELTKKCKKYNFKIYFSFMLGVPLLPENIGNYKNYIKKEFNGLVNIIDRIAKIEKDHMFYLSIYTPFPGSPLYELSKKLGFKEPKTLEEWGEIDFKKVELPWLEKKYYKLINEIEELYIPFLTYNIFKKVDNYGILGKFAKILCYSLYPIILFRWKIRFFNFPVEYHSLKLGKKIYRKLYPRKQYKN